MLTAFVGRQKNMAQITLKHFVHVFNIRVRNVIVLKHVIRLILVKVNCIVIHCYQKSAHN